MFLQAYFKKGSATGCHVIIWRFLGVAEHQMTLDNEHKGREE